MIFGLGVTVDGGNIFDPPSRVKYIDQTAHIYKVNGIKIKKRFH